MCIYKSIAFQILFENYLVVGANTFSKAVWLFCSSWPEEVKKAFNTSSSRYNPPYIQAHHARSLPATQPKHRQPVCGKICNPSSLHDPGCISQIQEDTCMLVTGKSSSGHVMRAGACSLSDPPGKWSVRKP